MLKRTLTIGILLILGLVLMAVGPPPDEDALLDKTIIGDVDGVVHVDTDDWVFSVIWGDVPDGGGGSGASGSSGMAYGDSPPAWLPPLPQEVLDSLPQHLQIVQERGGQAGGASGASAAAVGYECALDLNPPSRSGQNVKSYAYWRCSGTSVVSTRLIPSHRDAAVYVWPGSGFPPSRE